MKTGCRIVLLVVLSSSGLFARSSAAAVQPGDFLVTDGSSSVVNIAAGGDFSDAPPFATGLAQPHGICVGPGGDVYVVESGSSEVTIITEGGDFTNVEPFASGVEAIQISCSADRILVADYTDGEVVDITMGGDFTGAEPFAFGLASPYSVLIEHDGVVFATAFDVSARDTSTAIWDVTAGGDVSGDAPFASHSLGNVQEFRGLARRGPLLLASEAYFNDITDYGTGVRSYENFHVNCYVGLDGAVMDLEDAGAAGLFVGGYNYPTDGAVFDISSGEDCEPGMEFAHGFGTPFVAGMVYVRGTCGDGDATPEEYCDDAGESATCNADCTTAACGDGKLNAAAGEDCDDGNIDDGDECPATCQIASATTEGSSSDGASSEGDGTEESSSTTDNVGPDSSGGIGETSSAGASADSGETLDGDTGSTSGTETGDTAPSDTSSESGCSCRSTTGDTEPAWWLALWLISRRRRATVRRRPASS